MPNWNDYKNYVRETNPVIAEDIDEAEVLSQIVGAIIEQRHNLSLSQRALAELLRMLGHALRDVIGDGDRDSSAGARDDTDEDADEGADDGGQDDGSATLIFG